MKISIVISVFNGSVFLQEQLDSIKNQTKKADEVIICDDVSSDNSRTLIKTYIKKNCLEKSWKLVENKKNKGWRKNFFDGIKMCSGDYIFTCDQDDIWMPNKIEVMYNIMTKNNVIDVLVSDYISFSNSSNMHPKNTVKLAVKQLKINKHFMKVKRPGCTFCFKKNFFDSIERYWNKDFNHDAFLWRSAIIKGTLYICNQQLIYWRQHSNSTFAIEKNTVRNSKAIRLELLKKLNCELSTYQSYASNEKFLKSLNYINYALKRNSSRINLIEQLTFPNLLKEVYFLPSFDYKRSFIRDILVSLKGEN